MILNLVKSLHLKLGFDDKRGCFRFGGARSCEVSAAALLRVAEIGATPDVTMAT